MQPVRLHLAGAPGLVEQVRDLTEREASCCSFFTFVVDGTDHDLTLDIAVRDNLRAAIDAGCDDLHECPSSDCCPLPFAEITTSTPDA